MLQQPGCVAQEDGHCHLPLLTSSPVRPRAGNAQLCKMIPAGGAPQAAWLGRGVAYVTGPIPPVSYLFLDLPAIPARLPAMPDLPLFPEPL